MRTSQHKATEGHWRTLEDTGGFEFKFKLDHLLLGLFIEIMRLIIILSLCCVCYARNATEHYPFTPRANKEPIVACTSDNDCGHGFCRKQTCLCDYDWATQDTDEPCTYSRYSRTTALLLQIFLGAFGVGITVLGWTGAIVLHWGFMIGACCAVGTASAEDDQTDKSICCGLISSLLAIGIIAVYITAIVFIAGNACMDSNGVACGS